MKIKQVMTKEAECTRPDASLQDVAARMKDLGVGSLPVMENDRLVGMITDRDITIRSTAGAQDPRKTTVREVMTPRVVQVSEDEEVEEAARLMEENQIRRLAVVDREERLVGIVSLGDLAVRSGDEELSAEALGQISEPSEPNR